VQDRTPGETPRKPIVPRTTQSLRLTFAYDLDESNGGVRLVRVERVRQMAPGISMMPPEPGQSGAWFEMRDAGGTLLYYQPVHDPMPTSREAFADEAGRPALSRTPIAKRSGEFQVLAPDLPDAAVFTFRASLPAAAQARQPARRGAPQAQDEQPSRGADELARLSFDDLRRRAERLR
jgi:hypothetical protein